jgi:hypothetical protein
MLLIFRVEMRPRRRKIRGVTLRILVEVNAMFPRRQAMHIERHPDTSGILGVSGSECGRAHILPFRILEFNSRATGREKSRSKDGRTN